MSFFCKNWGKIFFYNLVYYYHIVNGYFKKKSLLRKKKNLLKGISIIVSISNEIIYDSKNNGEMPDDLYNSLLAYGLFEEVRKTKISASQKKDEQLHKKTPSTPVIHYTLAYPPINEDKKVV